MHNKVIEKRICTKCNKEAAVMWYTKRGRMNVMCLLCGERWDINDSNCPKERC